MRIAASLRLMNEIGERLFSHRSVKSRDLGVWGEEESGISFSCKNYLLTWVIRFFRSVPSLPSLVFQ